MSSFKLLRYFPKLRCLPASYRHSLTSHMIQGRNSHSINTVTVVQRDGSSWNTGQEEIYRPSYLSAGLCLGIGILYAWDLFPRVEAKEAPSESSHADPEMEHVSKLYEKEIEARNTKEIGLLNQREKFNFIANVVETTAPAVVYIEIKDINRRNFFGGSQTFSNGSGFVIKEDGLILTNAHVVIGRPHSIVQVKLQDGRIFQGQVEDIDTVSDLATVRIPCNNLPTLKLGNSSTVKPGEFVVAMGSPLSLANTITSGVVSSVNRGSYELGLRGRDMEYIQTDAAITFGNSGGPLVNLDGEVIGINAMKVTAGISFAIPIDYAKEFLLAQEKRKEQGTGWLGPWMGRKSTESRAPGSPRSPVQSQRRFMGVTLLTLTPQLILELQMRGTDLASDVYNGVLVWKVVLGSPAHSAGLQPGDVIVSINGRPISTSKDVYKELEGRDQVLKLGVVRKRQHLTVDVRPEESS